MLDLILLKMELQSFGFPILKMALNPQILEERELAESHDREIEECRKVNRHLLYGFFLGTTLSTAPPVLMPVDVLAHDGHSIVRHKDPNIIAYSLCLGYIGIVASFVYMESNQRKQRKSESVQSQLCAEINHYYNQEDGLGE